MQGRNNCNCRLRQQTDVIHSLTYKGRLPCGQGKTGREEKERKTSGKLISQVSLHGHRHI